MESKIKYTVFTLLIALLLVACGKTATQKETERVRRSQTPNSLSWDTLTIKNSQPLDAKGVKASASIEINYIVPKEYEKKEIVDRITSSLNSIVLGEDMSIQGGVASEALKNYSDNYIESYKREAKSQLALWQKINGKGANAYFSYDKKISTKLAYSEANLISYQVETVEAKGDDVSTTIVRNVVFDLSTGNLLVANDLFVDGAEEKLNQIIIAQVIKDKNAEKVEDLHFLGYWGISDIAADDNFLIGKDGITYTFSPGEYSDASLGILNVFIDYDKLTEVLKKDSPITILVQNIE